MVSLQSSMLMPTDLGPNYVEIVEECLPGMDAWIIIVTERPSDDVSHIEVKWEEYNDLCARRAPLLPHLPLPLRRPHPQLLVLHR
uniref:Uncharacterized protein n=1 Tax=Arundo donax TaxID=35708 RepID=A0A0A8YS67_ARUDO